MDRGDVLKLEMDIFKSLNKKLFITKYFNLLIIKRKVFSKINKLTIINKNDILYTYQFGINIINYIKLNYNKNINTKDFLYNTKYIKNIIISQDGICFIINNKDNADEYMIFFDEKENNILYKTGSGVRFYIECDNININTLDKKLKCGTKNDIKKIYKNFINVLLKINKEEEYNE